MNILSLLRRAIQPRARSARYQPRHEPDFIADRMSKGGIHSIFDSAQNGQVSDMFTLYRDILVSDSHIQCELGKRKLAVIGEPLSVQPWDKQQPPDVEASAAVEVMIADCPQWFEACSHLLDATLWPVAAVEKVFAPGGGRRFAIADLVPVPYQLLDYRSGSLAILDVEPVSGRPLQTSAAPDPHRYIVHRGHLLSTSLPDHWGGPFRSLVFWWFFSAADRSWWARYLERYGAPFMLGKYPRGQDADRAALADSFRQTAIANGAAIPDDCTVELVQAAAGQTGDAYDKFLTICRREISKLILGQTLSAEAQPTGLGSGVAAVHEGVRQDIRRLDATLLARTLTDQVVRQYLRLNGLRGHPPVMVWGSESPDEIKRTGELLVALYQAGFEADDSGIPNLSERTGIPLRRRAAPEVGAVRPFLGGWTA